MPDKRPANSPEYLSHKEWAQIRRGKWYKRRRIARLIILIPVVAFAFFAIRPLLPQIFDKGRLLRSLEHIGDYQVDVQLYSPGGELSPFRVETYSGQDWWLDLWGGQAKFAKHGSVINGYEPASGLVMQSTAWAGTPPFLDGVLKSLQDLSLFQVLPPHFEALPGPTNSNVFRWTIGDARYSALSDSETFKPWRILVERRGNSGWYRSQLALFTYGTSAAPQEGMRPVAPANPGRLVAKTASQLEGLNHCVLRSAELNTKGGVFFRLSGLKPGLKPEVDVEYPGVGFYSDTVPDPMDAAGALIEGTPVKDMGLHFPLKVTVRFFQGNSQFPRRVEGRFSYVFRKPTCFLVPSGYLSGAPSDLAYHRYLGESALKLANFYNHIYYKNGRPFQAQAYMVHFGFVAEPKDREWALHELSDAIFYDQQAGGSDDAGRASELSDIWLQAYYVQKGLGRDEAAKVDLLKAIDLMGRISQSGTVATRIRTAMWQENMR